MIIALKRVFFPPLSLPSDRAGGFFMCARRTDKTAEKPTPHKRGQLKKEKAFAEISKQVGFIK